MADKQQDYRPRLGQRWKKFSQADESGMTFQKELGRAAKNGFLLKDSDGVPWALMVSGMILFSTGIVIPFAEHNNYDPQSNLEHSDMDISLTEGYETAFGYRAIELPDGQTIMVVRDENDVWRVYKEAEGENSSSGTAEEVIFVESPTEAYAAILRARSALQDKIDAFSNHVESPEGRTQLLDFGEITKLYEFDDEAIRTTDMPFSAVETGQSFLETYQTTIEELETAGEDVLDGQYGFQQDNSPIELTERPDNHFLTTLGVVFGVSASIGAGMGAFGTTVNTGRAVMRRRKRHKNRNKLNQLDHN